MPTPHDLAQQRLAAIADLQAKLSTGVDAAQHALYERLLENLTDIHANPALLPALLQQYAAATLAPLAAAYGQALLHLPALQVGYFQALDVAGYQQLLAPLTGYLTARLGVDATGAVVPGSYLDLMAGNTTVRQQVLTYTYNAKASGVGIEGYRAGLKALVLGGDKPAEGLVQTLYKSSYDDFSKTDRALQQVASDRLGLKAAIYQGGLIDSSRPFCKVRNGKCFLDSEIALMGTAKDVYGGYTNKSEGLFSGKSEPYDPFVDCGGYSCRHGWHYVPNVVALRMRPDLGEDKDGKLFSK